MDHLTGSFVIGLVLAQGVLLGRQEQLVQRLFFHAANTLRRHAKLAFFVLLQEAFFHQQLEHFRVIVIHAIEPAQNIFAVFQQVFGELVKHRLCGQRLKPLRPIPLAVFKSRHTSVQMASGGRGSCRAFHVTARREPRLRSSPFLTLSECFLPHEVKNHALIRPIFRLRYQFMPHRVVHNISPLFIITVSLS